MQPFQALLSLALVGLVSAKSKAPTVKPADKPAASPAGNGNSPQSVVSIQQIISTAYDYAASPTVGYDPSILTIKNVNIPFGNNVTFPATSVNATANSTLLVGIKVQENRILQKMIGVGCGVSDASSIVLQGVKDEAPEVYDQIMQLLWSRDPKTANGDSIGASLTQVRSPLGASDFGIAEYTYSGTADCSPDTNLTLFNVNQAPKMWSTHKDILKINPDIKSWFNPWTAPTWMKVPCGYRGGKLDRKYEEVYAEYLARSMRDIAKVIGKSPSHIGLQESPRNEPKDYPGQLIDASQAARLANSLRKKLDAQGQKELGITALEASWDSLDYAVQAFDEADNDAFSGVSFHCCSGDPEVQRDFAAKYPEKKIYQTECTRTTQGGEEFWLNLRKNALSMLFGGVANGASNIMTWNCVLQSDDNGFTTPSLPGTCKNCLAPVLVTRPSGTQVVSQQANSTSPSGGQGSTTFKLTSDYALLAHVSRAIRNPHDNGYGNVIGVTTTDENLKFKTDDGARVFSLAFKSLLSSGKERYTLLILQKADHYLTGNFERAQVVVGFRNQTASLDLGVGLHTIVWEADVLN